MYSRGLLRIVAPRRFLNRVLRESMPSVLGALVLFTLFLITPLSSITAFQPVRRFAQCIGTFEHPIIPSSNAPPETTLPTRCNWNFSVTPQFCKKIVQAPTMYAGCHRNEHTKFCPNGEVNMFSQYFQDYYVYTRHFSKLKRRGIYVDLAANHPWYISNTFFLDSCLGWDGICIEAHPKYKRLLQEQRSCKVIPKCVSDMEGDKISFILDDVYSGSASTNKYLNTWKNEGKKLVEIPMKCTTLKTVFQENQVLKIDYMSLDVEGHELPILKGIDWKKVQIDILNVELSSASQPKIDRFLRKKGYVQHVPDLTPESRSTGLLIEDAIYVRKGVSFGRPE